jgi:molybdopterin-guanine dinucleotide biosynthesis protein A
VPKHAQGYEPLAAFYPRKLLSLAEKAREQEDYSLQHLVARAMAQPQIIAQVVTPETCSHFQNANSPAEFDLPELVRCSRKGT